MLIKPPHFTTTKDHSTIHIYHKDGYYVSNGGWGNTPATDHSDPVNRYDRYSLRSDDHHIFSDLIYFNIRYRYGNKKLPIVPTRLIVWTAGQNEDLEFNPIYFKIVNFFIRPPFIEIMKYIFGVSV